MTDQISPLRRSQTIAPYTDAEQFLLDNAFASPFTRSLQQAINTDVAGAYRQQALEAQVRGDAAGQRAAEYNRQSSLRRMDLPTVGPTTWDAAKETGNYADYVKNVLGSMAGSMVKPTIGSSIGGLVGGLPGAAIGGFGGSFSAIRNAELENYANDEQLKMLSPAEQLRVTRNSAALQAVPEAIMPAYFGAGGRLPGALNRVPTALRAAGSIATEGGTEGLQDYISQRVAQSQFPDREIDWNSVRENAIAGLIGGGAMGVLGRHDSDAGRGAPTPAARPATGEGSLMDAVPPTDGGGSGPVDTMLGKVAGLGAAVRDRFGDDIAAVGGKAKDIVLDAYANPDGLLNKAAGLGAAVRDRFGDDIAAVGGKAKDIVSDAYANPDGLLNKVAGLGAAVRDRFGDDIAAAGGKAKDIVLDAYANPDELLSKAAGLGAAVQDRFGDDIAAVGGKAKDMAGKAKDIVSDTLDRMTEAVSTSATPGEFLSKVFGSSIDEEAAADLSDQPNPTLKGATFKETEANIDRDDGQRIARAARYADELLNDPATPDAVKQRVADMGGDYTSPDNQSFVARALVAQRGGEKVVKAVHDLVDLGKSAFAKGSEAASKGLSAAKKAAGDAAMAAQERIVKKNLQSATPAEQAAFGKVIFDGLTDEAKANPLVRAQLAQVTNAVIAFAAKTGDITAKDLPTLTKLANAMSLFKDPDAMAAQLVAYGAIPRTEDSFIGRIKRIQNAQQDLKKPNSFLVSSLTPEAREELTTPQLQRVAQLVDQFTVLDSADSKKGTALVQGLASAFGSPESAKAVLDYYAQQNKADVRFDPNETLADPSDERDAGEVIDSSEGKFSRSINERDAGKAVFRFKDAKSMRPFFKGSKGINIARRDGTLGNEGTQTPYSYAEYVKETGKDPEAERNRLLKLIDGLIAEHEKHKKEDRSAMINALKGERYMFEEAYERGGAEEALSLYEVLRTEAKDQNDLVATDEDLAKYASKKSASRVTFRRTDGTKLMLSAESMWKSFGDKTKSDTSGGKEGYTDRARRLFNEAVASVLDREDIAGLETDIDGIQLDDQGTVLNEKLSPADRAAIREALEKSSVSYEDVKKRMERIVETYQNMPEDDPETRSWRWDAREYINSHVKQGQRALDNATTAPQRASIKRKLEAYLSAQAEIVEFDRGFETEGDIVEEKPGISRLRKEMDTSKGVRYVEEDTGLAIDARAPKAGTDPTTVPKNSSRNTLQALVKDGKAVERNGVYYIADKGATKYIAGTTKKGTVYVNMARLAEDGLTEYLTTGPTALQKQAVLKELGTTPERLDEVLGTNRRRAAFLRDHELGHKKAEDHKNYPKKADGSLDLMHPDAIAIETRVTRDALTEGELAALKGAPTTTEAKTKNPAASSRETAKKVNDSQALSPDALTALHDVAVKENFHRLDTPVKVLKFAAMAAKAREQLKKISELERTDEQDDLHYKLNDMFDQSKGFAFDWESLWDGLDPTDAQKAQLEGLIHPKAEPGTARQEGGAGAGGFSAMHSSPANHAGVFDWRKFSGSGEGNAAYGAGTYLSTAAGVNNWYRSKFMPGNVSKPIARAIELAKEALGPGASAEQLRQYLVDSAKLGVKSLYKQLPDNVFTGEAAKTYDVHVDLDPDTFLDWDGPINENSSVYERIERMLLTPGVLPAKLVNYTFPGEDTGLGAFGAPDLKEESVRGVVEDAINDPEKVSGGELYKALAGWLGSQEKASELLMEHGIPGSVHHTKSLKGDDGRNYVVFDDQKIRTVSKWSSMKPKRGRPGKVDQQEILDEIVRIRGKDVEVAFAKFADIGASGEFSMNKDKTERLIRIAVNSLNPMGVAWHEALHDFVAMLGGSQAERKLKADLLNAAEAPQVMKRLRELLKDHPDALRQIETDREERLAYMYQFWAEGALTLGPTGTGIFSRIVTFFREMLGVLSQDQKIDQLFTALHSGKFSEPSLVGAVLEDLKAQTLGDKLRAVSGPIGDTAEAMFTGATDRLRNTNVDALIELADLFHREPGREIHNTVNTGAKPSFASSVDSIGRKAAEARLAAGEDAEKVFADTKWFKDAQGKMVREIDDSRLFKAAWEAVKGAVASNADLLKVFDAVLDGKIERLGTLSLKDMLEDMGLPHMAARVGDVQIELSSGEESHILRSKDKITAVQIGLAQAFDGNVSKLSAEDRKNAVANVGALTVLHEVQHVLQVLDGRADDMFTGEYSEQRGEIEAFDVEARYVARYIAEKLGGEEPSLPELAKKVPSMVDMEHSDFAANVTQPMFTKRHSARRTYGGSGATQELPFLQRRAQQVGKRLNKLQDILKDTTSEERHRALENMQNMKPASTPLEKELAAYLKEMHDYMVDRGVKRFDTKTKKWVDLGNVKDYFPRVWDKEVIRSNEAEFINLMEQYVGKAQARETFNALVNGDGSLEHAENEHALGFTPWNPAVLDRQFTFINPSNAAAFAKFQSKDIADIMTSYTQRAVHRAEYAHDFGNDGEVIAAKLLEAQKQGATQDELAMARKATMAMEGTLGYDFNPRLKEVMSGIMTFQNIVLLPLSLFSNLIDPLGVALRSNDMKEAWKAFTYGMKGIADQLRGAGDDAQTEMAKLLGIIDEQNMLEAMGHVYNSMHMSSSMKKINNKFFRYNGMEMWNKRMRVAAMMAAQRFILANLGHERYLSELGITDSDVFQLADGTIALTKDQLLQAGAKKSEVSDIEKRIQAAVFKWVDSAVLRPNAAHRPIWGSDPRYQLIFHLKQFTYSFHNTILRRVGEELKHGNVTPSWILMSYVPFMFLSDVLKGSLTGTLNTTADLYDVASQSIARSGIMGTGVFGADAMGDLERGKLPGTSFLGPAFDHLMTLLSGITGHAGVDQVVNRSVPFAKYI